MSSMRSGLLPVLLWAGVAALGCTASTATQTPQDARRAGLDAPSDKPNLPILVPPERYGRGVLLVRPAHYAWSNTGGGLSLSIHGSPARPGAVEPAPSVQRFRGVTGLLALAEGIKTATWLERGGAYALDIECATADDRRCLDDAWALELLESLHEAP